MSFFDRFRSQPKVDMPDQPKVEFNTPIPPNPDFTMWTEQMLARQQQMHEQLTDFKYTFKGHEEVTLNFMGDLHVGHPSTHYTRIQEEVQAIKENPTGYAVLLGDLIDHMHWNPGQFEQMEQTPEQISYAQALMRELAQEGKLLLAVEGNHDQWLTRGGYNLYRDLPAQGVHATNGPVQMEATVQQGKDEQEYRLGMSHLLPGHSIYNPTHPQMRAEREIFRGADVVVSGHTHRKGNSRTYVNEWGGVRSVDMINIGAYKPTDGWLKSKGYKPQSHEQMYGTAVKLMPGEKYVIVIDDILKGNK